MKKEYVCIVCPNSCRLSVEEVKESNESNKIVVTGYGCQRGIVYGRDEHTNPKRMLTTTVVIEGGTLPRLPVIGAGEIPKAKLRECLAELMELSVAAPVKCGDVVARNVGATGVDVLAARSMGMKSMGMQS
jgi:CxxC motif-containing protein